MHRKKLTPKQRITNNKTFWQTVEPFLSDNIWNESL